MREEFYLIKSGPGYLADPKTGQMVADTGDPVSAALRAKRMNWEEVGKVAVEMQDRGLEVEIIRLIMGTIDREEGGP